MDAGAENEYADGYSGDLAGVCAVHLEQFFAACGYVVSLAYVVDDSQLPGGGRQRDERIGGHRNDGHGECVIRCALCDADDDTGQLVCVCSGG